MFGCKKCTAHAFSAILRDTKLQSFRAPAPLVLTPHASRRQQRRYASLTTQAPKTDDEAVPFDNATEKVGISPVPKRHLELELRWLTDRVKLANYVRDTVNKKDGFEKAVALVRLASSSEAYGQCVVAWNHLLRHAMSQGKMEQAWSLYNDMKKRAQRPDSHTYAAMIKGLVSTPSKDQLPSPKQVTRAVSIFNSMYTPNSKVKPTAIHANAAIKACALIRDMDQMWSVVSRLDEEGANAADAVTYTIILDGLRESALQNVKPDSSLEQVQRLKLEAVEQGRNIWIDVVKRWKAGQITMDERLVISMARLLLFSSHLKDWDDVLDLFSQTMDIDRRIDPLRQTTRKTGHIPGASHKASNIADSSTPNADAFLPVEAFPSTATPKERSKRMDTFNFVRPGNGTLSIILETCHVMRSPKAAAGYWNSLVMTEFRINPDLLNVERFLRICSTNRSSATAASIMESIPKFGVVPRDITFRIAMEACIRNINNPAALGHAGQVVAMMSRYLDHAEMRVLDQYLDLAWRNENGVEMIKTLEKAYTIMSQPSKASSGGRPFEFYDSAAASRVYQNMVGVIDKLSAGKLYTDNKSQELWQQHRANITKLISELKSMPQESQQTYASPIPSMSQRKSKGTRQISSRSPFKGTKRVEIKPPGFADSHADLMG